MRNNIIISLYGQQAVTTAYRLQKNKCYTSIMKNNTKIAQLEVVIDEPGLYNGLSQKWVDITICNSDFYTVANVLSNIGFKNCWAMVYLESECGERITDEMFFKV